MCVCDLIRFVWTVYRDEEKVIMESKKTRVKKSSWQLHLSPDQTKIVWSTRLWNAAKKNLICVLTNVFHRYVSESLCRFRAKFQYMFLRKTWCMWCHHKDITQIQKCTFWMCFSEYLLSFFMQSCGIIWHIYLAQVLFSCRQWWNVLITVDQPHKVLMLLLSSFWGKYCTSHWHGNFSYS